MRSATFSVVALLSFVMNVAAFPQSYDSDSLYVRDHDFEAREIDSEPVQLYRRELCEGYSRPMTGKLCSEVAGNNGFSSNGRCYSGSTFRTITEKGDCYMPHPSPRYRGVPTPGGSRKSQVAAQRR
ncbi:hypothetical protein AX17_006152 [Amanita inopinata Kibby_2008]|nr:hypothetical protein AX17_006152 [Amanita inopinata Kibby_2008]